MAGNHFVCGSAMNTDPQAGGVKQAQPLSNQAADHTTEHIAHTAGGHSRVADIGQRHLPAIGDQGSGTFQHHDTAVFFLQLCYRSKAVGLDFGAEVLLVDADLSDIGLDDYSNYYKETLKNLGVNYLYWGSLRTKAFGDALGTSPPRAGMSSCS